MEKILVITGSDVLGFPALFKIKEQNRLAAVAIPAKVAGYLIPMLKSFGLKDNEIHILTKNNLTAELTDLIATYKPAAVFTLTFPWLIPAELLDLLPNRFINFHFGLLPKYKGADPIFWQIKNGESNCGLTVHIMNTDIDAGPVVLRKEISIIPGENYGYNAHRLGVLGGESVTEVLSLIDTNQLRPTPMPDEPSLYLKKPSQADIIINWQHQTATEIENLVNAANPRYQGAITSLRGTQINLLEVSLIDINNPEQQQFIPGTIVHADQLYGPIVACLNNQYLKINVACLQQGYFSGVKLFSIGFAVGEIFQ